MILSYSQWKLNEAAEQDSRPELSPLEKRVLLLLRKLDQLDDAETEKDQFHKNLKEEDIKKVNAQLKDLLDGKPNLEAFHDLLNLKNDMAEAAEKLKEINSKKDKDADDEEKMRTLRDKIDTSKEKYAEKMKEYKPTKA